jgi:hypothetical protein
MPGINIIFVVFFVALFAAACIIILLKPDQYFTPNREIVCPENRQPAAIKLDIGYRIRTLFRGDGESLRLKSCSRWPARQDCGEECLLQVDLNPRMLDEVLRKWYEGKSCALCHRALTERDWRLGRFAAIDRNSEFVSASEILRSVELTTALAQHRPVCGECQSAQLARRKMTLLKGDRRAAKEEGWTGE